MSLPAQVRIPPASALLLALMALVPKANTQPYSTWATEGFTTAERSAGQAAPSQDPDGDGWPNLLEYALSTDPGDPRSLPKPYFQTDPAHAICPLPGDPRDAGVGLQTSGDLIEWQPAPAVTIGDGAMSAPLGSSRFLRLRAFALPGPMLDSDGDGLHDLFEERLALESAEDAIINIGDVNPLDDHDGDGVLNIDEAASQHPAGCGFPPAPLLDPAAVAVAANGMIQPPARFSVHTPLR